MAARRVRVYTTCALPLLWPPPLQPEYLLLQVYTHSLLLLIISSSFRLAELPCYSQRPRSFPSMFLSPDIFSFLPSSFLYSYSPSPFFFRYMILFSFIHFVSICSSRILYVYLTGSNCQKGQEKGEVIEGAERLCWRAFYFCTANIIGILIPWYVFPRKFSFFLKFIAVYKKHPFPTS